MANTICSQNKKKMKIRGQQVSLFATDRTTMSACFCRIISVCYHHRIAATRAAVIINVVILQHNIHFQTCGEAEREPPKMASSTIVTGKRLSYFFICIVFLLPSSPHDCSPQPHPNKRVDALRWYETRWDPHGRAKASLGGSILRAMTFLYGYHIIMAMHHSPPILIFVFHSGAGTAFRFHFSWGGGHSTNAWDSLLPFIQQACIFNLVINGWRWQEPPSGRDDDDDIHLNVWFTSAGKIHFASECLHIIITISGTDEVIPVGSAFYIAGALSTGLTRKS